MTDVKQVVAQLRALADPEKIEIKARRFGIRTENSLGVYHQDLKLIAKDIGRDNELALALFESGIYEARLLCSKIYDPACITKKQMKQWVKVFDNWEICDSFCMGFFAKSQHALPMAYEWSEHRSEFIKRAGFVIMAAYGFADKLADNQVFEGFFPAIEREADDNRVYVKKAVNWALRNVGKRNVDLREKALKLAYRILEQDTKSAVWIAKNAIKELEAAKPKGLEYPRSIYRA